MMDEFESALNSLLNFDDNDCDAAEKYNALFKQMISASMQICGETDFGSLVKQKVESLKQKYGHKVEIEEGEEDSYKMLREAVRFEMSREALLAGKEFEICCTEGNFRNAMAKFRGELEKIVPQGQAEVVDSISQALYSDFTNFFVNVSLDMVADAKIYQMKEFRPLQLNAMGKEIRTYANVVKQQNGKPQKSETVTNWFRTLFVLPAFLFKSLYAVNMIGMFQVSPKHVDGAARMFDIFTRTNESFAAGDEYKILLDFLEEMDLGNCFTVRPRVQKSASDAAQKPLVN